jgi:hypothetical protein
MEGLELAGEECGWRGLVELREEGGVLGESVLRCKVSNAFVQVISALLAGAIYYQLGSDSTSVQDRYGALFFLRCVVLSVEEVYDGSVRWDLLSKPGCTPLICSLLAQHGRCVWGSMNEMLAIACASTA